MAPLLRVISAATAACTIATSLAACSAQASGGDNPSAASMNAGAPPNSDDKKKEPERVPVTIAGRTFKLEPALDDATRFKGLGDRTEIASDGGMLFVFTDTMVRNFVMRDCPAAIDILYLDGAGRILSMYEMLPEEPRKASEPKPEPGSRLEDPYEARLKHYSSRFPTGLVVELRGGTLKELGVKPGDKVAFDIEGLKKRAR